MPEILVIGAGVTGLSTAYFLEQNGYQCKVIAGPKLGGVISTKIVNNFSEQFRLESGPNVLLLKPELFELLKSLGMEDQILYPSIFPYKQCVFTKPLKNFENRNLKVHGRIVEVPKSLIAFLKFPLLTFVQKIQLLIKIFKRRILFSESNDLSISNFLEPWIGKDLVNQIVNPAFQGIYGGDINLLSARSVMPNFWQAAKEGKSVFQFLKSKGKSPKVALFKDGMSQLIKALSGKLKNSKIIELSVTKIEGIDQHYNVYLNDGSIMQATHLFIASHAKDNISFMAEISPQYVAEARKINYVPMIVAHFAVAKKNFPFNQHFGVLYPAGMETGVLGVMFNSVIFPEVAEGEKHLLTICLGGENRGELLEMEDQQIIELCKMELANSLKISGIEFLSITKIPQAIVQYQQDHYKFIEIVEELQQQHQNLFILGWETGGIGVPDRVAKAKIAVNRFLSINQ
jgi:oxygen-dependent protoporphyrinogen oxidase